MELYPAAAPKTVSNFLQYVKSKHYSGTIFHRVISNFMVQGGGYDAKYAEKATRTPVAHEGREALKAGLKNTTGTVAMARTNDPNSATAQFFINVVDNAFLDPTPIPDGDPVAKFTFQGRTYPNVPRAQLVNHPQLAGYTVFGKIISGMDVVHKIRNLPTLPVVIQKLKQAVADPNADSARIAKIIADDPAMMARILKVVNSVLYGASVPINSLQMAVARMGLNAVNNIAMSFSCCPV